MSGDPQGIINQATATEENKYVNPGLAFLLRASVRHYLVEAGELTIEEAIMGLTPAFFDLVHCVWVENADLQSASTDPTFGNPGKVAI